LKFSSERSGRGRGGKKKEDQEGGREKGGGEKEDQLWDLIP